MKRRLQVEHVEYSCDVCDFKTRLKTNFKRHSQTKKHFRNDNLARHTCDVDATDSDRIDLVERQNNDEGFGTVSNKSKVQHTPKYMYPCIKLPAMEISSDSDQDIQEEINGSWFPFESKLQMYLYMLIHSKTHTLSDETANFIWFIMKECGIKMPSFHSIKSMTMGDLTPESMVSRNEGPDGTPFWSLNPSCLIKLEMSHPETSNCLRRYARTSLSGCSPVIRDQCDGKKWQSEIISHWAEQGSHNFYAGDFVLDINTNKMGKIKTFLQDIQGNGMYAKVQLFQVGRNDNIKWLVCSDEQETLNLCNLQLFNVEDFTFYESVDSQLVMASDDENIRRSSRPQDIIRPTFTVPVNIFMDDTSANKSKRWKPLHCLQMQLSGIPTETKQDTRNIKFLSASAEVPIMDMVKAAVTDIIDTKCGFDAFDASRKEIVTIKPELALCVCDYNMLAEASNHMGANTKKFCPRCYADASSCVEKGKERNPSETLRILQHLSINDSKDIRQNYGLKPYSNELWGIINPHRDIPVGLLHWIYLGLGKHLIKVCLSDLCESGKNQLEKLLESLDQSAFETKLSTDIIQYLDSRQGKDIKTYLQIAPFHFALVGLPRNKVQLLCELAELSKMFCCKKDFNASDIEQVQMKIKRYLVNISSTYPCLLKKVKTHLSTHIVDDIQTHGPLSGFKEDGFEKMHGRIREQIFIQNQHARSRDTAMAMAELEILQHVLTGGYFSKNGEWMQAANSTLNQASCKEVCSFMGWRQKLPQQNTSNLRKGDRTANSKLISKDILAEDLAGVEVMCNQHGLHLPQVKIVYFKAVEASSSEIVNSNTPILFRCGKEENIGIFVKGMKISDGRNKMNCVKIRKMEHYTESNELGFSVEKVYALDDYVFINSVNVLQIISLVHDCVSEHCRMKEGMIRINVEQEYKDVIRKTWDHRGLRSFYVNKFCFANRKNKYSETSEN